MCVRARVRPDAQTNTASESDVFPPTAAELKTHLRRKAAVTHGRLWLVFAEQISRGDKPGLKLPSTEVNVPRERGGERGSERELDRLVFFVVLPALSRRGTVPFTDPINALP